MLVCNLLSLSIVLFHHKDLAVYLWSLKSTSIKIILQKYNINTWCLIFCNLQSQVRSQRQLWYLFCSYLYQVPLFQHTIPQKILLTAPLNLFLALVNCLTSSHVQHTTIATISITQHREQEQYGNVLYISICSREGERNTKMTQTKPNVWSPFKILKSFLHHKPWKRCQCEKV